jgi:hypothetical protein
MSSMSLLASSEVCQKCALCCKRLTILEFNRNYAQRWQWLNDPKIQVKERKLRNGNYAWIIVVDKPCSKLGYDSKADHYFCENYNGERPDFCKEYPDNIPVSDWFVERENCPIIEKRFKELETKKP